MSAEPFPWQAAMAFGFGVLKLSSRDFWALTPRELAAAIDGARGHGAVPPMDRARFEALLARYPDPAAGG